VDNPVLFSHIKELERNSGFIPETLTFPRNPDLPIPETLTSCPRNPDLSGRKPLSVKDLRNAKVLKVLMFLKEQHQ